MKFTAPPVPDRISTIAETPEQTTLAVTPRTPETPYFEDFRGPIPTNPDKIFLKELPLPDMDEKLFEYAANYKDKPVLLQPLVSPTLSTLAPLTLDRSNEGFLENSMVVNEVEGVLEGLKRQQKGERAGREITLKIEELKPKAAKLLRDSSVFSYFEDVNQLQRFVEFSGGFPFEYRPGKFHTISTQRLTDAIRENDFHFLGTQQQEGLSDLIARSDEKFIPVESIKPEL